MHDLLDVNCKHTNKKSESIHNKEQENKKEEEHQDRQQKGVQQEVLNHGSNKQDKGGLPIPEQWEPSERVEESNGQSNVSLMKDVENDEEENEHSETLPRSPMQFFVEQDTFVQQMPTVQKNPIVEHVPSDSQNNSEADEEGKNCGCVSIRSCVIL